MKITWNGYTYFISKKGQYKKQTHEETPIIITEKEYDNIIEKWNKIFK